jgi:hypothetical protein
VFVSVGVAAREASTTQVWARVSEGDADLWSALCHVRSVQGGTCRQVH